MAVVPAAPVPAALADGVNPFVSRTYQVLLATLCGVVLCGVASYAWLPRNWLGPVSSADGLIWVACGWFGWRRPVSLVLPVFSLINGLSLGLAAHLSPDVFLYAMVLTLAAFASLTAYVHVTRQDFSFLRGFLCASFFVLVIGGTIAGFTHSRFGHVGLAIFGTLVFLCWILYDTSEIIQRVEGDELTPGVAAFELLLDIIALHSWLLDLFQQILGNFSSD